MLIFLRNLPFLFCALLLLELCRPASGLAGISPDLQRVLDHSPPDTELSVILTLEPSREIEQLSHKDGRKQRSLRLQTLQRVTREAHRQLAGYLDMHGAEVKRELWLVHGLAISARAGVITRLEEHPQIATIHLNRTYLLSEVEPLAFLRPGWNLETIGAPDLWDLGFRGRGTVVAVLDSGVQLDHPDLENRWRGTEANPASGWFDPFDLSRLPTDLPSLTEDFGHGTAVTGLIVAGDQSGHELGVAPDAEWIAARIFDENGLSNDATIVASLQWTMDPDNDGNASDAADIVNASWGLTATGQCLPVFRSAVQQLKNSGIAVVAAAGNGGPDGLTSQSPANYPEVLAVGATDATDLITEFSSRGPSPCDEGTYPDLVAPGIGLTTTNITKVFSDYAVVAGTSFSTPQVAGVLALLMEAFPDADIATLEAALRSSALDLGVPGPDDTYGYGRLNALAAYNDLTGNTPPPAPQLDAPAEGARVTGPEVTVSWFQSADADGDRIEHEINWVPTEPAITPLSRSAQPASPAVLLYAGAGGLLFLAVPAIRCRQRHVRLIIIALLLTAALLLSSCGGGGGDADTQALSGTPGGFTLTGLESGTTYEWWVVAVDSRGGRTPSVIRTFQVE